MSIAFQSNAFQRDAFQVAKTIAWCGVIPSPETKDWQHPSEGLGPIDFDDLGDGLKSVIGADYFGYFIEATKIPGPVGSNITDVTAFKGMCRRAVSGGSSGEILSGPAQSNIIAGIYWTIFRLKVSSNVSSSNICTISVRVTRGGGGTTISSRTLKPTDFVSSNVWQSFSLVTELRGNDTALMVYVTFTAGIADLSVDTIRLWPLGAVSTELIENLAVSNAKISDLDAVKITAGDIAAARMQVNAANAINAGAVSISPGRVLISGTTMLSDWRHGSDLTQIDGGDIFANSITANKIVIGSRNLSIQGIEISANAPTANIMYWTAGVISYIKDDGTTADVTISAGDVAWTSGTIYLYWVKDATTLSTTTTRATAFGTNNIVLASYRGGTDLVVNYGRTIVDGSDILAGTITATQLSTGELITVSAQIKDAIISDAKITSCSIDKLTAGNLTATGTITTGKFQTAASPLPRIEITQTQIAGFSDATTRQFYLQASDGKAYAGGGAVVLDSTGIRCTGAALYFWWGATKMGSLGSHSSDYTLFQVEVGRLRIESKTDLTLYCVSGPAGMSSGTSPAYIGYHGSGIGRYNIGADLVPFTHNLHALGSTTHKWNVLYCVSVGSSAHKGMGYFSSLPSCPEGLTTQPNALALIRAIKPPQVDETGRWSFKDKDFPSEMKCKAVETREEEIEVDDKKQVTRRQYETGEEEIEYIRTIGVLVQAVRELTAKVDALESRIQG